MRIVDRIRKYWLVRAISKPRRFSRKLSIDCLGERLPLNADPIGFKAVRSLLENETVLFGTAHTHPDGTTRLVDTGVLNVAGVVTFREPVTLSNSIIVRLSSVITSGGGYLSTWGDGTGLMLSGTPFSRTGGAGGNVGLGLSQSGLLVINDTWRYDERKGGLQDVLIQAAGPMRVVTAMPDSRIGEGPILANIADGSPHITELRYEQLSGQEYGMLSVWTDNQLTVAVPNIDLKQMLGSNLIYVAAGGANGGAFSNTDVISLQVFVPDTIPPVVINDAPESSTTTTQHPLSTALEPNPPTKSIKDASDNERDTSTTTNHAAESSAKLPSPAEFDEVFATNEPSVDRVGIDSAIADFEMVEPPLFVESQSTSASSEVDIAIMLHMEASSEASEPSNPEATITLQTNAAVVLPIRQTAVSSRSAPTTTGIGNFTEQLVPTPTRDRYPSVEDVVKKKIDSISAGMLTDIQGPNAETIAAESVLELDVCLYMADRMPPVVNGRIITVTIASMLLLEAAPPDPLNIIASNVGMTSRLDSHDYNFRSERICFAAIGSNVVVEGWFVAVACLAPLSIAAQFSIAYDQLSSLGNHAKNKAGVTEELCDVPPARPMRRLRSVGDVLHNATSISESCAGPIDQVHDQDTAEKLQVSAAIVFAGVGATTALVIAPNSLRWLVETSASHAVAHGTGVSP